MSLTTKAKRTEILHTPPALLRIQSIVMASPSTGSTKPKRYLRAVLRPEEWEDYESVVIERLGRKAEAKLHQSLTTVRGFHPEFISAAQEMDKKIQKLGPSPLKGESE